MNATATQANVPPSRRLLRPRWFFAGLVLGLMVMSWLGRRAGQSDYHPNFTRFFPAISPEASYYPTVDEMAAIVRARCRPDQILVIVGGNSVLQGVWQPADVMWTRKLQAQLGDHYSVINFALRGAAPADGGAVVAEVLRNEFPRQIYLANEKPATSFNALGNKTYRFLFWQAYFSGRLLDDADRNGQVRRELLALHGWTETPGIVGAELLDRGLRFHDFWNRMAMETLNTVPSLYAPAPPALFSPRKLFTDEEPDGTNLTEERRYLPSVREVEMEILRASSGIAYQQDADGTWRMNAKARAAVTRDCGAAIPASLHARTLMLVGRDSTFFRRQLKPDEAARDEQGIRDAVELFRSLGYASIDYGRDFTEVDYSDRTHLAPSGGEKLADGVAKEIQSMASRLGYLR
jgi:hypothetical protein